MGFLVLELRCDEGNTGTRSVGEEDGRKGLLHGELQVATLTARTAAWSVRGPRPK